MRSRGIEVNSRLGASLFQVDLAERLVSVNDCARRGPFNKLTDHENLLAHGDVYFSLSCYVKSRLQLTFCQQANVWTELSSFSCIVLYYFGKQISSAFSFVSRDACGIEGLFLHGIIISPPLLGERGIFFQCSRNGNREEASHSEAMPPGEEKLFSACFQT